MKDKIKSQLAHVKPFKPTKKHWLIGGSITGFFVLVGVLSFAATSSDSLEVINAKKEKPFTLKGSGFVPQIEKEEKVATVATPKPVQLTPERLFKNIEPEVDPRVVRERAARKAFLARSNQGLRQASSIQKITYGDERLRMVNANYKFPHLFNRGLDYSAHEEPKTTTSYPTDLSRVLPMTEVIPAILLDEIKSELAGEVVRVSIPQKVFSYHENNILIPQGTIAIGKYKPLSKVGDTRLDIEFYRMITPEGINIKIEGFAVDQEGSQGITGDVDNKNLEKFGTAGIVAALQGAAQLSVDVESDSQQAAADAIAAPLNEVVAQVLSSSINIAPTVRIRKGTQLNIKFKSDIWFPEPMNPNQRFIKTKAISLSEEGVGS
jgi:type IV secretory pathway VirB10-like protein